MLVKYSNIRPATERCSVQVHTRRRDGLQEASFSLDRTPAITT